MPAAPMLALCVGIALSPLAGATAGSNGTSKAPLEDLAIEDLFKLTVSAASRQVQSVGDAPAAVTVVTAEDIRKFGYRTLGDVIGSIRGAYISSDRAYQYFGYRGFARAGDYNTRVLLLIDGNRINDNIYDQATIGSEFPLEIESVARVEFVPGSASALYGSNAFFGVINVITRHEDAKAGSQAVVKADNRNRWSAWGAYTSRFSSDGKLSIDVAKRGGDGPSLYYPAFDTPESNFGREDRVDFEKTRRLWAKLSVSDVGVSLTHKDRNKGLSGAPYGVIFNDPRTTYRDTFTSLDATKAVAFAEALDASFRFFWGEYRFRGSYRFADAAFNQDYSQGSWHGGEARVTWRGRPGHSVLLGVDYQRDSKMLQRNFDVDPFALYLDDRHQRSRYGLYVQDEWRFGTSILGLGLRHDRAPGETATTNPRFSWVTPFGDGYVFKAVYGTAFRAPNAYERFYVFTSGPSPMKIDPRLQPERIRSFDLILERSYGNWNASLNAYAYRMRDLIQEVIDPADGNAVFTNIAGTRGKGVDGEVKYRWANGAILQASVSLQDVRESSNGERSVNSPSRLAKMRFSLPLSAKGLTMAFDAQGIARRLGDAGAVPGSASANLVLTGMRPIKGLELGAAVYNLLNANVLHPVPLAAFSFNAMQQDARQVQLWVRCEF